MSTYSEIENSIKGIQRPEADPYLYSKIFNRIQTGAEEYLEPKFVWITACSFLILIALNGLIFQKSRIVTQTKQQEVKQLSNAMQLINENTINYN